MAMQVDFVTFNVIIDDLVFSDGRTVMGILGGGGPQTAFGIRLWADSVGLSAGVGSDLPSEALEQMERLQLDISGLRYSDYPTLRAWQVLEQDGRRTQVWRVSPRVVGSQIRRSFDLLPAGYRQAKGYHLGVHPLELDLEFIEALRATGAWVSIEPFKPAERLPTPEELRRLLLAGQIFSPNLEEAVSLIGPGTPEVLVGRFLELGAGLVTLRMGAAGCLVGGGGAEQPVYIPAVPVKVVDVVGAGNAFCGGFLAGYVQTGQALRAGLMASVSASFLVEQVGCPHGINEMVRFEAKQRLLELETRLDQQ